MKVLLTILAGIVALFAGGCVIVIGGSAAYGSGVNAILVPMLAVAAANIALIAGVLRSRTWAIPLLWIFVAIDLVFAGILAVALGGDRYVGAPAIIAAVFLALKAIAQGVSAHRLRQGQDPAE
jgi:hypothetical protein